MRKLAMLLLLALGTAACQKDMIDPDEPPLRLSGTMKLAADSLSVILRLTNLSDTTQVVKWVDCREAQPTNFALYRDAQFTQRAWERRRMTGRPACEFVEAEEALAPDESVGIRGSPVGIQEMLGDSLAPGRYFVAILPLAVSARPAGGSYEAPIEAVVPVGAIELGGP